jgi:lipopolysaccharide/colanic/teichoic acid biosynthesis glycosyltransferase
MVSNPPSFAKWLMTPVWRKLPERFGQALKRLTDIVLAALGLLLLAPFLAIIAVLIKTDSPGPVFFRGRRCGKGCQPFGILKFRTMYERPQSYAGPKVTGQNDNRVTRIGRWLRQTKLNELPQLWNVLKGEMSLVGPRPEDYDIAMDWPEEVRYEVLSVRPGLTSPASVLYRDEENLLTAGQVMDTYLTAILPSKLRLDQLYVRHRSFLLDLDVIFWTFLVLLPRLGNHAPPENLLFIGPITRFIRRYVSWFMVDTIVTFLAVAFTGAVWRLYGPLNVGIFNSTVAAVGFAFLFSATGALLGANRISWGRARPADALDLVPALGVATAAAVILNRLIQNEYYDQPWFPEGMILVSAVVSTGGFLLARYRQRVLLALMDWLTSRRGVAAAQERVMVVGSGEAGQFVAWWLQNGRSAKAFRVVGCVDDDMYQQGLRIHGMNVLGQTADIPQLAAQHDVGIILYAIHNISSAERRRILDLCYQTSAEVVLMPDLLSTLRDAAEHERDDTRPRKPRMKMLAEFPAAQVDAWLADLAQLADDGDCEQLQDRIRALRGRMMG